MKHQSTLNNLWFTDPIAILLAIAAGSGVLIDGLWRKRSLGYTLAGILLPFFVLLVSATLSMGILQARDGNPDAIPMLGIFGTLLAVAIGMIAWYLKSLRLKPVMGYDEAINEPQTLIYP